MIACVQPLDGSAWNQCSYKVNAEIMCKALFVSLGGECICEKFIRGAMLGSPEVLTVVVVTHVSCLRLPSDSFEIT